ncbi:unnamed protein product [Rhizophagus irregularis]|nr:unnamed protein product [Rhizophagus irregularis]
MFFFYFCIGNRLQRERRYSRNSVPTWIPIFQEIGSNVDADIPDKDRFWRGYRNPKGRVDFRRIDEPRFVSASRWIYRFRLSVLGLWMYRFQLSVSTFGSWVLDRYRSGFHFEFLVGFLFRTSIEWVSLSDFCQIE